MQVKVKVLLRLERLYPHPFAIIPKCRISDFFIQRFYLRHSISHRFALALNPAAVGPLPSRRPQPLLPPRPWQPESQARTAMGNMMSGGADRLALVALSHVIQCEFFFSLHSSRRLMKLTPPSPSSRTCRRVQAEELSSWAYEKS